MATLVADPLLGFVDTAVVGRVGTSELGALGLAVAVLTALSWIFNFLVYGTTAAVARAAGAGDDRGAGRRVAHAAQFAVALGLAAGLVIFVAARPLLEVVGAVPELIEPAASYMRIRAFGVPFFLLAFVGHGAFRGVADTRTPLVVVAVANVLNAGLTILLVLRWGWGLDGAAWATVVAEVTAVLLFALLLRRVGLPLTGHGRPSRDELGVLVRVSRDLFIRTGGLVFGLLVVHTAAARISAVTAAAHQVLWQVWIIVSFFMDGFAIAAQAMVGNALGAGRPAIARETARDLLLWGVGGGAVVAGILLAVAGPLPRVLTDEGEVLAVVAVVWWLAAGGHVLNGSVFVLDGVLMGAGDFAYLRTWTVIAAAVAGVGAQLVTMTDLTGGRALLWLWVALEAMMVVRFVSLVWRLRGDQWNRVGERLPAEAV